ncbi:Fumitremorgin C synthase [Leucoagaricus sp. SymC.cos]|nr:Fumitremorgin C synthase [Leucoagaricus sp. SymC.cos]
MRVRWNPIVPMGVPHMTNDEDVYKGYYIPKNCTIMANTYAMLHDEEVFLDPMEFKPERFIDDDGGIREDLPDPESIATFGFGRRVCPGAHIARSALYLTAASLLYLFDISPALDDRSKPILVTPKFTAASITSAPLPFPCKFNERGLHDGAYVTAPGKYFANIFPELTHIPERMPGAGFKKVAKEVRARLDENMEYPWNSAWMPLKVVLFKTVLLQKLLRSAMLHDEEVFLDPMEFKPERFIDDDGGIREDLPDPESIATFGFGRRVCPGAHIARSALYLTAASLLYLFDISPALDDRSKPILVTPKFTAASITSAPLPFPCKVTLREGKDVVGLLKEFGGTDPI